jgi:hypothetical protein
VIYGRGHKPDPEGYRRVPFHRLAARMGIDVAPPPEGSSLREFTPSGRGLGVLNQGPTSACSFHSAGAAAFTTFAASGKPLSWVPSPKAGYRNGRLIDLTPNPDGSYTLADDGAQPNMVFRAANEFGIEPMRGPTSDGRNSDCEPATVNEVPKLGDLEVEARSLIVGQYGIYSQGPQRVLELRAALARRPVCIALDASSAMFNNYRGGVLPALGTGLDHYVMLIGARPTPSGLWKFEGLNSWSEGWGEGGFFWLSEDAVQQLGDLVVADFQMVKS